MILRMTLMLRGIPLEKRGFLHRMGFMEGTARVPLPWRARRTSLRTARRTSSGSGPALARLPGQPACGSA
jgi:hypothetical protein